MRAATDTAPTAAVRTRVDTAVRRAGVGRHCGAACTGTVPVCELPSWRAALANSLRLGSSRVLCWNVSASRSSAATYADLAALGRELLWYMADNSATACRVGGGGGAGPGSASH